MITTEKYNQLKAKIAIYNAWVNSIRNPRNGWASYKPSDVPPGVAVPSNDEISQVEVYEFCHNPPKKYTVYIKRNFVAVDRLDNKITATTWTGQILGHGVLGQRYYTGKLHHRSIRYSVTFQGINNVTYRGIYYASSGDYAHVHAV